MVRKKKIITYRHALTLFIVFISIIAYSFPPFSDLLVYDRQEVLNGEVWRLLTAPLVHFSASHMFWDIVVFGTVGVAIEAVGFRCFWLVCSFAAVIPSLLFLLLFPDIERYGGLSGLATAAAAYFCLCSVYRSKKNCIIWLAILAFIGIKIFAEASIGVPFFVQADKIPFRVLPSAHIIGYLVALVTMMWVCPNITLHRTPS